MIKCCLCKNKCTYLDDDDEEMFNGNNLTVTINYNKTDNTDIELISDLYYCKDCFKFAELKADYILQQMINGKNVDLNKNKQDIVDKIEDKNKKTNKTTKKNKKN